MSMPDAMSNDAVQTAWTQLAEQVRTGVLLTLRNGRPFGSHVPYLIGTDWSRVYLHLSRLAFHTQHLLADGRVSLFIAEPDGPGKNPLALQRMNLQGKAAVLAPTDSSYEAVRQRYQEKFPQSKMMFGFGDFSLWELKMQDAHLVLGFGQAYTAQASAPATWKHQAPDKKP
ncbi:MAG: pyridoxamine 5'-phosphate oxidase family protein [Nitrospiraceae bacterium]|nr:pyridoxamine 5'-phosphate oxidase family protein [Nitrospiraceae bacterium]